MDIDNLDLHHFLFLELPALEFEVYYEFEHQIIAEASMARTEKQRESFKELLDRARVDLKVEDSSFKITLRYLSVPKGMEEYAETIKQNVSTMIIPKIKDIITEDMQYGEMRDAVYESCKKIALEHIKQALGGVS